MIGLLARETILLRRSYDCAHEWVPYAQEQPGSQEEQCVKCTIIATPEGKQHHARMAARFHGRPVSGT